MDRYIHLTMVANLLEHVVEEAQTCRNVTTACAIEVETHEDVSLACGAPHFCNALTGIESLGNAFPCEAVLTEDECLATEVLCQLSVGLAVADDVAASLVDVGVLQVVGEHSRSRLAHGRVVFREVAVDELLVEGDSLVLECLQDEVMYGPERLFWERWRAETVLVAHHDEAEVGVSAYEAQVLEHPLGESQFLEGVYLFVGRLSDESAVAVYE